MRFAIVSKHKKDIPQLKQLLKKHNLKFSTKNPDYVLSLGGDGTLLIAEHKYPEIPKIAVKNSPTCIKCDDTPLDKLFLKLSKNQFSIIEESKLDVLVEYKNKKIKMKGMNDFIIRNSNISRAIRFSLKINNQIKNKLIIGDGLVISTPFGSTAYFKNITRKSFKKGFGLAYNNTNIIEKMLKLKEGDVVEIELLRGPADISTDHQKHPRILEEKSKITIKQSNEKARIIRLK